MATEDEEDASRAPLPDVRGEVAFDDVTLRVQRRRAGAEARVVPRAGRIDDGAGRVERIGQEHADQPGDGVQPAAVRPRARRRPRPDDGQAARLPRAPRRRAAGQLPLRRHDRREHRLRAGRTRRARRSRRSAASRTATSSSRRSRRATTRSSASAACGCRAASASAWRSRARSSPIPTHPDPRRGDVEPRQRERGADPGRPASRCGRAARRSSSRTGCRRSAAPIRSWCSSTARSSSAARTTSCWRRTAATGSCTTSSTGSSAIASSIRARTSRRSRRRSRRRRARSTAL